MLTRSVKHNETDCGDGDHGKRGGHSDEQAPPCIGLLPGMPRARGRYCQLRRVRAEIPFVGADMMFERTGEVDALGVAIAP